MGHMQPPLGWSIATGAVLATIWILEGDTVVNKNWGYTNGDLYLMMGRRPHLWIRPGWLLLIRSKVWERPKQEYRSDKERRGRRGRVNHHSSPRQSV